ncbi:hypothetical protein HUJ05_009527 [Dendroctonus ponderosae]|nr:hypothetical protein HUJ05_009527 [Dendroctonus ponderosae]
MNALWVGSDVDLPTLHKCRLAEKLEFRLTCLVNNKARSEHSMKTYDEVFDRLDYDSSPKQTRSGTWKNKISQRTITSTTFWTMWANYEKFGHGYVSTIFDLS